MKCFLCVGVLGWVILNAGFGETTKYNYWLHASFSYFCTSAFCGELQQVEERDNSQIILEFLTLLGKSGGGTER